MMEIQVGLQDFFSEGKGFEVVALRSQVWSGEGGGVKGAKPPNASEVFEIVK